MDLDDPDDIFGERKVKQELPSASYSINSKAYYDESYGQQDSGEYTEEIVNQRLPDVESFGEKGKVISVSYSNAEEEYESEEEEEE